MPKETLSSKMSIDILKYVDSDDILKDCKELGEIECFRKYLQNPDSAISLTPLFVFVILLYSQDSFLNRKPIEDLSLRKIKAAKLADIDIEKEGIRERLLELKSDQILNLVVGYLIHQHNYAWTELITLESQMEEAIKLRMRPIDDENKDKDLIDAFGKKAALTRHSQEWAEMRKKYADEIFFDHEDVRSKMRTPRSSLEAFAK